MRISRRQLRRLILREVRLLIEGNEDAVNGLITSSKAAGYEFVLRGHESGGWACAPEDLNPNGGEIIGWWLNSDIHPQGTVPGPAGNEMRAIVNIVNKKFGSDFKILSTEGFSHTGPIGGSGESWFVVTGNTKEIADCH